MHRTVDALIAGGVTQATGYRRLSHPEALTHGELSGIAAHFGVPLPVLVGGEMSVMKWLVDGAGPPDGGPGSGSWAPRGSNSRPMGYVFGQLELPINSSAVAA